MLKLGQDYTIDNLLLSRKKTYQIQPQTQLTCVLGVERHLTRRTHQIIAAQNRTQDTQPDWVSRLTVCSIFTVPFSIWTQSLWCKRSENFCLINRLATTRHIPFTKAENNEEFIQPAVGKPDPDRVLITAYVPNPAHKFSLFVLPLTSAPLFQIPGQVIWYIAKN